MKKERVNCNNCIHYYITWDKKFPRGCRAMNFKSRQLPSVLVYNSSGSHCLRFMSKNERLQGRSK